MRNLIAAIACIGFALTSTAQNASAPTAALSPQAAKAKTTVSRLTPGDKLSVIEVSGMEEFGTLTAATEETFTFHNVDTSIDRTLRYEDVSKVRPGYGGYNSFTHRHTDNHKRLIAGVVVLGGLVALFVLVATQRD